MDTEFTDTIAGIATAPGEAGVSVIRISGKKAIPIADRLFRPKFGKPLRQQHSRYFAFGWIEKEGTTIDEVLVCVMRRPNSFTAEDVVEVHCHGGSYITYTILELIIDLGARLSEPGEFTQRAFLNGRIDLTQAEATNDLIKAKSAMGLELVVNQLKGKLFNKISAVKEEISWILSLVNAGIDFPEEDIVFSNLDEIKNRLGSVRDTLERLVTSANTGIKIREGYKVVLIGRPNVGKSKILNGLLEEARSIVNKIPGTTRDTIEESCVIEGIPVSIIDTAGIHDAGDDVEKEGIERAFDAIRKADLILWVIDISIPSFESKFEEVIDISTIPILMVLNKSDLSPDAKIGIPDRWRVNPRIVISALNEEDIQRLRREIFSFVSGKKGVMTEDTMLTNIRQKRSTESALKAIVKTQEAVDSEIGEELLAVELSQVLSELGNIIGETTPDELLNQIFSEFCIGK